jgi:hypothetical protein
MVCQRVKLGSMSYTFLSIMFGHNLWRLALMHLQAQTCQHMHGILGLIKEQTWGRVKSLISQATIMMFMLSSSYVLENSYLLLLSYGKMVGNNKILIKP